MTELFDYYVALCQGNPFAAFVIACAVLFLVVACIHGDRTNK